mgnify:CR=1 FL=1|jgi:phage-related protein
MIGKERFKIIYLNDALEFLESLEEKVKEKIVYNISKAMFVVDKDLFKKMGDTDIWEFRTMYRGMAYRLFAFWDTESETLVVATHGFVKKSQKTPQKEIEKAEKIRKQYFDLKK